MLRRLIAPAVLAACASLLIFAAENRGPYVLWNLAPILVTLLLCAYTLWRGGGRWSGRGWHWPLATLGFAIPAIGLSLYLHAGMLLDLGGMATRSRTPELLFRFLPWYTLFAGAIGFAIGWIIGRSAAAGARRLREPPAPN